MTSSDIEPVRSSVVQIKIGNRTYDAVQNRHCATCMHPARFQIEAKLLLNYGYAAVSRYVSELNQQKRDGSIEEWPELTPAQIKRHLESGHCPVEGELGRALVEERAKERGIDLTEANGQYLDHIIVKRAILARGYELLVRGNIEPDVKDTLAAAKLLGETESAESQGASEEQWQEFMSIYFNAVQSVVSHEQWDEIKSHIMAHPAFRSMKATNNEEEPIDAEVIEEGTL
jgi:hypothetical protein